MAITAVLFDLDGTLWEQTAAPDWEQITALQVKLIGPHWERLGALDADPAELVRAFWERFVAANPELPDTPHDRLRLREGPAILRETLAAYGSSCAADDAVRLWDALHGVPEAVFNNRLFPDAASTLTSLAASGLRLGIVTTRPERAATMSKKLGRDGLPDVFSTVVTAGEVGYRKPHPILFETAAARLGVAPTDVAVVGDSYENDIVPAAGLGMATVLKLNGREPHPAWTKAEWRVAELGELCSLDLFARPAK